MSTTPSQTVGPFFSIGLTWAHGPDAVAEDVPDAIRIEGCVYDGAGAPVPDAVVETWQASPEPAFARCPTDAAGRWHVRTRMPDVIDDEQAPHLDVSVFARGLLHRVVTRIYFAELDNDADPVLASVDPERRGTLLAEPLDDDGVYRFDIRLQGASETVFFAL